MRRRIDGISGRGSPTSSGRTRFPWQFGHFLAFRGEKKPLTVVLLSRSEQLGPYSPTTQQLFEDCRPKFTLL